MEVEFPHVFNPTLTTEYERGQGLQSLDIALIVFFKFSFMLVLTFGHAVN